MKKLIHCFCSVVLASTLTSFSALAQATASATIQGTVTDKTAASIPNAEVKITSAETSQIRTTASNEAGIYRFDLLKAGTYEVRITAKGFNTLVFNNVVASVSQTTTIDASLDPSTQTQVVTVEGTGAPIVDTQKTDVGLPITTEMVQDLPLNGRDFVSLAYLAPGAKPVNSYDPTKNRTGVFGLNGSNGRNVNVTVNGIDNKDNTVGGPVMQLPLEAVQEFNISTQRFSAANGRSEGAAVNVVTKSGGNQFHGSAYGFFRDVAFNSKNYFESEKAPFSRQQFGGSIGGPVRKDKDFLFFAIERIRERTSLNVTPQAFAELSLVSSLGAKPVQTISTPYDDWRYNGRWDHVINSKHNFFLSYTNQNNKGENDQSAQTNDLTAGNFTTNQLIVANATLNSVLSPRLVNSFTGGYQYWNNLIDSTNRLPYFLFPNGIFFGTNPNVPQQSYQAKWQVRDDLSLTLGNHTLKFGGDYIFMPKLGGFFGNTVTNYTFFDLPSVITADKVKYPQGFATPGALQAVSASQGNPYFNIQDNIFMFGTYLQDDWKVSRRLTMNIGVRYDVDHNLLGSNQLSLNRPVQALKAIGSPYGAAPPTNLGNTSPRFGLAYDLTGNGKHVLRAGYGLYFGQPFVNIPLFALQLTNKDLYATVVDLTNNVTPGTTSGRSDIVPGTNILLQNYRLGVDPAVAIPPPATSLPNGSSGRTVDPGYKNPYSQQWNGGYAWSFNPNNVVEVEYVHILAVHESKRSNLNPILNGSRLLGSAFAAAGQTQYGRIIVEEPIGRSRYDALNVSWRRRLSNHFSINTNYVLSRAVGYQGSSAAFGNAPTNYLNLFSSTDYGYVPNDERHRWVVSGVVQLPWGITFAPIMQLASARAYTPTQGITDVFGFGSGVGATHAVLLKGQESNLTATKAYSSQQLRDCITAGNCVQAGLGSLRGQTFFQLDARFGKNLKFGERKSLDLFFQAFDLTDRANFGNNYVANIRSATFGQPNGFLAPSSTIVPRSFAGEFGSTFRF